ncbi:Uncharacterised protein [Legionella donaldsonii]|uniref:Uncharacterized protein n=1 Tax=Legionella donaldsonii TaxID=45060 RepID=A0A378IZM3_9GAMM|nr:hypothetical protein [Legionella donaldsonii]STX40785.1 Uncharacterised protein [Legionella donaldsonii]
MPTQLWDTFHAKFPIFAYEPAEKIKFPAYEKSSIQYNDSQAIKKEVIKNAFKELSEGKGLLKQRTRVSDQLSGFKFFANQLNLEEIKEILAHAAKNNKLNTDIVRFTFSSSLIEVAIEDLKKENVLQDKHIKRLIELREQYKPEQHELFKSLNFQKIHQLVKILREGQLTSLEFKELFEDPQFPHMVLKLMDSKLGKGINYSQLFTMLELHQAVNPRKSQGKEYKQSFSDDESRSLPIYQILDESGNFTREARQYFLPALTSKKGPPLNEEDLKEMISKLPRSEQIFYRLKRGTQGSLGHAIDTEGAFYYSDKNDKLNFMEPSCGVRNALGLLRYGADYAPVIPQLGPKTMAMVHNALKGGYRVGQMCIGSSLTKGFSPAEVHLSENETFFTIFKHDVYHSEVVSPIPEYCRKGLLKMIEVVFDGAKLPQSSWTKQLWYWADADYRFFKMTKEARNWLRDVPPDQLSPMEQFCVMLDTRQTSGMSTYGGLIENNRLGSTEGILVLLDMVEHPKKWKEEIGLDPDDFPDGSREPFNVLHVPQNYKEVYRRLKDTAMAIPGFFARGKAEQVFLIQILEAFPELEHNLGKLAAFSSLLQKQDVFNYIKLLPTTPTAAIKKDSELLKNRNGLVLAINGQYNEHQLVGLRNLFMNTMNNLSVLDNMNKAELSRQITFYRESHNKITDFISNIKGAGYSDPILNGLITQQEKNLKSGILDYASIMEIQRYLLKITEKKLGFSLFRGKNEVLALEFAQKWLPEINTLIEYLNSAASNVYSETHQSDIDISGLFTNK